MAGDAASTFDLLVIVSTGENENSGTSSENVEHFVGLLYISVVPVVRREENWPSFFPTSQLLEKLWPANCFFHRKMHDFFP